MRALRPDKLTLAALLATLMIYEEGTELEDVPTLRMLTEQLPAIARRKDALLAALVGIDGIVAHEQRTRSAVGGGALPLAEVDSWATSVRAEGMSSEDLAAALSAGDPCVAVRVQNDAVMFDLRTVAHEEVDLIARALARVVARGNDRNTNAGGYDGHGDSLG
jgi:L-seryl-tRNA(Ser) seleniumtransferase